ncbi:MAG: peptide ABC transporter substrate-binding protein [Opitutaceae bacterium]
MSFSSVKLLGRSGFLVGAAVVLLSGCRPQAPSAGPSSLISPSRVLRISQRNEPADLDPAIASLPDAFFVIRALSEGLVLPAMPGRPPEPGAADRWTTSADGLTWTFHLRSGARWSNGDPVVAGDFLDSFRRALAPATAAPHPELFYPVHNARAFVEGTLKDFTKVGFAAPNASTFVVRLDAPNPLFLNYAASGAWIPEDPRVVRRYGRGWTRPGRYVGNGPYTLAEWSPNQRIVVDRNPLYHGAAKIRLDQIQFIRFDDGDTEDRAYRAGEVDVTMAVPAARIGTYEQDRPNELHRSALAETRYLAFNTRRRPLDDPRVREALALAIDRPRLVQDVLLEGQQPAFRLMPAALRPAGDTATRVGLGERESRGGESELEARELLASAGYPDGIGVPRLELSGWSGNPILEVIQAMWQRTLGVNVGVINRDARSHVAALQAGAYDIGFITLIPSVADPLAVLRQFVSDSPDNFSHWDDYLYDGMVRAAGLAPDRGRRNELLAAAEERLMNFAAVSPLYFNEHNWLMKPYVHGWMENELWTRCYLGLWIDRSPPRP